MLNVSSCRAALRARARYVRLLAPWACAWAVWAPTAHAAEAALPDHAVSAPLNDFQRWRDEPLQDWRQANDRVGQIGGWRTYLREAQPGDDGADAGHAHHGHPEH